MLALDAFDGGVLKPVKLVPKYAGVFCFVFLWLPLYGADDPADKVRSKRDFGNIRREIETLRGKKFTNEVPVFQVSAKELRAMSDRDLDKDYPGQKLKHYEELLAWVDMVPPHTDLKKAYGDFDAEQVAGLYDTDRKEMCIPMSPTNADSKVKKLETAYPGVDNIVLAHEFTHALEDQYWPLDDPEDNNPKLSTDRDTAHSFLTEGSATCEMIEAVPAEAKRTQAMDYFLAWNLIHSGIGEAILDYAIAGAWRGSDALVEGVPETIARSEAMPYAFGYSFCAEVMRKWGLDGLDYIYDHRPVSSEQVMHPRKAWEWRDFPVQINIPDELPGEWEQMSMDSLGEAGIALLFGCHFQNLRLGLEIGRGWDGDHVALFERPDGHRLLLWASSWDSTNAAGRFVAACGREREKVHQARITMSARLEWQRPDGRAGIAIRNGKRVILLETDEPGTLSDCEAVIKSIEFVEPAEDAIRRAANSPWRRFNPLWAWQKDGEYTVRRSFCGLLSRHDRNSVGAADTFLLGAMAESRRTRSFHKWELGGGLLVCHERDTRRQFSKTTFLPWGILASNASAAVPYSPEISIKRTSVLWGLGGSSTINAAGTHSLHILPFGLLLEKKSGSDQSSFHVLATGFSRQMIGDKSITRFRVLGFPVGRQSRTISLASETYRDPEPTVTNQ